MAPLVIDECIKDNVSVNNALGSAAPFCSAARRLFIAPKQTDGFAINVNANDQDRSLEEANMNSPTRVCVNGIKLTIRATGTGGGKRWPH